MMKNKKLYLTYLVFWLTSINLYSNDLKSLIREEVNKLNNYWGYKVNVEFNDSSAIESLPNRDLKINLSDLERICSNSVPEIKDNLIKFIIAHEFAHQIQYFYYKNNNKVLHNDLVSRTLLETQADILAGTLFMKSNPNLTRKFTTDVTFRDKILTEIFRTGFELGTKENTLGSHPSKRDRMLAIRMGMTMGIWQFMEDEAMRNPQRLLANGVTPDHFQKSRSSQFKFLNVLSSEDIISWSYRQASKIVNSDRKISTGITLTTPRHERHQFNSDQKKPFVEYNLTYKNDSNKKIAMEMEVYVALVDKEEPNSPKLFQKLNTDHYNFQLDPGDSITLSGEFNWMNNSNDTENLLGMDERKMPRIIYPHVGASEALYSCQLVENTSEIPQERIKFLNITSESNGIEIKTYLNSLINSFYFGKDELVQGIGEKHSFMDDRIVYFCSKQYNKDTKTFVITNDSGKVVRIEMYFSNFRNKNDLNSAYKNLKTILDMELNENDKDEGEGWVNFSKDDFDFYLEKDWDVPLEKYTLSLIMDVNS